MKLFCPVKMRTLAQINLFLSQRVINNPLRWWTIIIKDSIQARFRFPDVPPTVFEQFARSVLRLFVSK